MGCCSKDLLFYNKANSLSSLLSSGGHVPKMRLQNYAHFVVKNQATLQFNLRLDMKHAAHIFEIPIPISRTDT